MATSGAVAGDLAPVFWEAPESVDAVLGWVFSAEECLSCYTPAAELRRIQAEYGSRVRLSGVAVDVPPDYAEKFFRVQRLNGSITHLSRGEYQRLFGATPLPAMYVVQGGRIIEAWTAEDQNMVAMHIGLAELFED